MRRKIIAMLLLATMGLSLLLSPLSFISKASANETICQGAVGGNWSADGWCEIDTPTELDKIRTNADTLGGSYRLTANLDLSLYGNWEKIGVPGLGFEGEFDGNGYTISNLTIATTANYVGFFGYTAGATIQNVRLVDVRVTGVRYVGGLVGDAGGDSSKQTNIINSSVEGIVTGEGSTGLLVGYNERYSNIIDSYSQGEVIVIPSLNDSFGGLVGYNAGTITGSYTTVNVGAGAASGGLVGDNVNMGMPINESYWNRDTSGVGVSDGGIESNTEYMKLKDTYTDHHSTGHFAWDFTSSSPTWGMIQRVTYPLHYGDYKKVVLQSLEVQDTIVGGMPLVWDRAFAEDYGVYTLRSVNKTDTLEITAGTLNEDSDVTFFSGSDFGTVIPDSEDDHVVTVPLDEGENSFGIQVSGDNGLDAMYRLTVIRDSGATDNPHRIASADDLASIGTGGYELDDHYVLEADIDLAAYSSGAGWSPIGSAAEPFEGSFEGNHHAIRNLTIDRPGQSDVGLFGSTGHASIANVALLGVNVQGNDHVGGLVGNAITNSGGDTFSASRIIVQGTVAGNSGVGGIIGSSSSILDVEETYSAALIEGYNATGGLIGSHTGSGAIANSFWDVGASSQASSAGGGSGKSTADMMKPDTYGDAGWIFGAGGWGMIKDTTYPMPYERIDGVWLNNLSVTIAGEDQLVTFDKNAGYYELTLDAPAPDAAVTVVPNDAGASVAIDGQAGFAGTIDLEPGEINVIDIQVTGADGRQGLYRLAINVPVPKPIAVVVPVDGTYGIGAQLDFTVTYDYDVEVDDGNPPALPILLDGGEEMAEYDGQPVGDLDKLEFSYIVQDGDEAIGGIQLGDSLAAASAGSVVGAGDAAAASMELPSSLPATSGIVIDGIKPGITLTPSTTDSTKNPVTVTVDADGTGTAIVELKWASGELEATDFNADPSLGSDVTGGAFTVTEKDAYTVYAVDTAGNEQVEIIEIANIDTSVPAGSGGNPSVRQFLIDPNNDHTVTFDGLTLFIPAGAVGQFTYITVENVTDAARKLVGADQKLLSKAYELTKSTPGRFKKPITLSMDWTGEELGDDRQAVVAYYDEIAKQWVTLKRKKGEGSTLVGETDHFTVFAAIAVAAEPPAITDISHHWAEKAIMEGAAAGLVDGYPDGTFRPDRPVSRAEFVTMLHRMLEWPNGAGASFNDQADILPWAKDAVSAAVHTGIVTGYPDGTFRPDDQVVRAEAVAMIVKSAGLTVGRFAMTSFADDAAIMDWAKPLINAAHEAQLVKGQGGNKFNPQGALTRAEAVVFLLRLADFLN